jgi:hypothetical protein
MLLATLLLLATTAPAFASSHNDRVSFGNDITIADGDSAGDVVCVFCSVHIHGDVKGDVVAVFGSATVYANQEISGDIVVLGGDLGLGQQAEVHGDVVVAAGDAHVASEAQIHGSRTVFPGRLWLLIPFAPLLILIGIIWLIVYFVSNRRYRNPSYPVYPNNRRP